MTKKLIHDSGTGASDDLNHPLRDSWTHDEMREALLAYIGLMGASDWHYLGNSSELTDGPSVSKVLRALGFPYQDESQQGTSSSTANIIEPPSEVGMLTEDVFRDARSEVFEDGMESQFSRDLVSLIWRYGQLAVLEMARLICSEKVDPHVASEALKWVGRIKDSNTQSFRLWLLKRCLNSSSPQVRDGAGLGLSLLGDVSAIPSLEDAVRLEQIPELRNDLNQVLEFLRHAS